MATTCVGDLPELIADSVNGVFVDRDLDSRERGMRHAVSSYVPMATRLLTDIQEWQWPLRAPAFVSIFEDVLADAGHRSGADDRRTRSR